MVKMLPEISRNLTPSGTRTFLIDKNRPIVRSIAESEKSSKLVGYYKNRLSFLVEILKLCHIKGIIPLKILNLVPVLLAISCHWNKVVLHAACCIKLLKNKLETTYHSFYILQSLIDYVGPKFIDDYQLYMYLCREQPLCNTD